MARILAAMVSVKFWAKSRVRLCIMVGVIAGLIPLSAGALGMGEIDLKSALNQPFSAEIPITSKVPGEIDGLLVEIASVETFRQFGLDRAAFLSDFRFAVIDRTNGAVVQITSPRPVVEPFVTLLLEISWAQGRLLREYTVLLDPPVFATESVQPARAAPATRSAVSAPAVREETVPQATRRATTPAEAPRVTPPVARSSSERTDVDSDAYGPVKRTDTLWAIAGRLIADSPSVSRNQMMLAIYQANPEAFSGNINRLKAGMILRVPTADEIAIGGREATSEVRRQNEQWRSESVARTERQGGRLRLVPPPERDSSATEPAVQTGTRTGADDRQRATSDLEQQALQGRVSKLEDQLANSQRQLQLRDRELAALQQQLAGIEGQPEVVSTTQPGSDEAEASLDTPDLLVDTEAEPEAEPAAEPAVEDKAAAAAEATPAPIDVTPVQAEPANESVFTNPLVYISLLIVVLLAWLFARNRSKSAESETSRWGELDAVADEDISEEASEATTRLHATPPQDDAFVVEEAPSPDETSDDESVAPFAEGASEDWGGFVDESETPLERTISTDAAVNLDQADPLAESDFHMAYGLYDQAADLLTRAVESEPERKDLRMKLLEVYFIWENQDGFLQEARELQQRVDEAADPDWNKVLIMGKQICPDEALFAGGAVSLGSTESVDLEFGEDTGASSVDLQFDEAAASSLDLQIDEAADSLDFDVADDGLTANEGSGMIDFDFDSEEEATQVVENIGEHIGAEPSADAPTLETPTVESPAVHGAADSTLETPTLESPALDGAMDGTLETPTLESPALDGAMDRTLETPTLESPALQDDSENTAETPTIESRAAEWSDDQGDDQGDDNKPGGDDSVAASEQTAEIDLDDLDLDLSGFGDLDDDMLGDDTGTVDVQSEAADAGDEFEVDSLQFDGLDDDTRQQPVASLDDISADAGALDDLADDVESTAEMRKLGAVPEGGDTVEQPTVGGGGDTAEQPGLAAVADDDEISGSDELEIGDGFGGEIQDTGGVVEGATMTEVGTKLDLARAYIDMGDPDGARSILNEVLEEADADQKQIAQKLLEDIAD